MKSFFFRNVKNHNFYDFKIEYKLKIAIKKSFDNFVK
jgi:hypothetical protein